MKIKEMILALLLGFSIGQSVFAADPILGMRRPTKFCAELLKACLYDKNRLATLAALADYLDTLDQPQGRLLQGQIQLFQGWYNFRTHSLEGKVLIPGTIPAEVADTWYPYGVFTSRLQGWFPEQIWISSDFFRHRHRFMGRLPGFRFARFIDCFPRPLGDDQAVIEALSQISDRMNRNVLQIPTASNQLYLGYGDTSITVQKFHQGSQRRLTFFLRQSNGSYIAIPKLAFYVRHGGRYRTLYITDTEGSITLPPPVVRQFDQMQLIGY